MSKLDRFKLRTPRHSRIETDVEQTLWDNLYRIPLEGSHFRRQVEIGSYRSDFGSLRLKLLIEIDGLVHDEPAQKARDRRRDNWLEKEGYRVVRFTNHQVTTDMSSVLSAIELAIESQKRALGLATADHPTPALSRRPSPSRGG
jgi:very-short-patch-repair endonuclease